MDSNDCIVDMDEGNNSEDNDNNDSPADGDEKDSSDDNYTNFEDGSHYGDGNSDLNCQKEGNNAFIVQVCGGGKGKKGKGKKKGFQAQNNNNRNNNNGKNHQNSNNKNKGNQNNNCNKNNNNGNNNNGNNNNGNNNNGNNNNGNNNNGNNNNGKNNNGNNNNNQQYFRNCNNSKKFMTEVEVGYFLFNLIKSYRKEKIFQPLNSWILFLHYRFSCSFFFMGFLCVWFNWHVRNEIYCINNYNAEKRVDLWILNICLSYPYRLAPDGSRVYILFYRWVHYAFLILAFLFYVPRIVMKHFGNARLKQFIHDLNQCSVNNDSKDNENVQEQISDYFKGSYGTHESSYLLFLLNHILATSVTVFAFKFLNFVLQGKFFRLPYDTYPFHRDVENFEDKVSVLFPPFINCTIDNHSHMMNEREELLYCHLAFMEVFEKLFIFAWFLLAFLLIVGLLSSVSLIILLVTPFPRYILQTCLSTSPLRESKKVILENVPFGDMFVLYLVKCCVTEALFCRVLVDFQKMLEEKRLKKKSESLYSKIY